MGSELKSFNEFVNESNLPDIFKRTIYRLPTTEEIGEVNSHNLKADQLVNGFGYTIIGRGMKSDENARMILNSIKMLCDQYPENEEYKKALLQAE